jgi:Cu+-exporting ATPase
VTVLGSFLCSFVIIAAFGRHFITAIPKLFALKSDMNTLVGIGVLAAWGLSGWNFYQGNLAELYFDSSAFIALFVLTGQRLESHIQAKMNEHMSQLVELLPSEARRLSGDTEEMVQLGELKVGDRVKVLVGERVPCDGKLVGSQLSSFDESVVTGESVPQDRKMGDSIVQGALNVGQPIEIEVVHKAQDSLYEKIVEKVVETLAEKPAIQQKVDRFAKVFVPAVVLISIGTALFWKSYQPDSLVYMTTAISVLVIACPCALGMATPTAIFVGVLRAARNGFLIKSLDSVEKASEVSIIAFDKTGTLTLGKPQVRLMKSIENFSHKELLRTALSVERDSEHPYAEAIRIKAKEDGATAYAVNDLNVTPGKGVRGLVERNNKKESVCLGNLLWLYENGYDRTEIPEALMWDAEGTTDTVLWLGIDKKVVGTLYLADPLREEAPEVVQALQDGGYEVGMVTGDANNVAAGIAKELKLKFHNADVLPEEKATLIKRLSQPQKKGMDMVAKQVAFVGDGVNDAPALAEAHLGLAMGSGAAISQSTADIVLLSSGLKHLVKAFEILSSTRSLIRQNLSLSFGYNILAIPLAAGALYYKWGILLSPKVAAFAMAASSLTVLLNSLRAVRK